jgi:hypothetical protein
MITIPQAANRAQVIAGLRELADLLEANPGLLVTTYPEMLVHAGPVDTGTDDGDETAKRTVVDQAAAVLGVMPEDNAQAGHYEVQWLSRGEDPYQRHRVSYRVVAITRAAMQAHEAKHSYASNIAAGGAR